MPLYEYQCDSCGHRFEIIQKFSDPLVDVCPKCAKSAVRKLLSSPALQFKGTGWYITDYARKDKDKSGATGGAQEGKEETKTGDSKREESKSKEESSKGGDSG